MLKGLPTQIFAVARERTNRRNLRALLKFLVVLLALIVLYSVVFHLLMEREGQYHSWLTGVYWTLTVMSTLGFGDITFHTDLGRAFSILVLMTGTLFLLVLLPFTFIEFFYEPWMKAQAAARTPRGVAAETSGHLILTNHDVVTATLIRRLESYRNDYVLVVADADEALRLQDHGVKVAVGDLDDPETYRRVGVDRAAMVFTTSTDIANTNIAFAVRQAAEKVKIVSTVHDEAAADILELAGCNHVMRLDEIVGQWFARRVLGGSAASHVIEHVEGILIAEASANGTPLVGKTLIEARLRQSFGVTVAGVWQRGAFQAAQPDTRIEEHTVLLLVGSKQSLASYNEALQRFDRAETPVLILGGGRVGRATARALAKDGHDYRIVEKVPGRVTSSDRLIEGDAADLEVLRRGGIEETSTVVITTHDDDVNVYLTLYCRKLRPEVQIIARTTYERHVARLHRAGADVVMSYGSTGANTALNLLRGAKVLTVAEGLDFFRFTVPESLAGRTIAETALRQHTGCSVVAVSVEGTMKIVPGPDEVLPRGAEMLLIGTVEAQERFLRTLGAK